MDELQKIKETDSYWYSMWLKEVNLAVDTEDRLAKSNELSLHRYEVGEEILKENANLRSKIKELQEWIEEVAISNCRAYDFGYSEGYRKGLVDADAHSYAAGYSDGCSGSDYDDGTI